MQPPNCELPNSRNRAKGADYELAFTRVYARIGAEGRRLEQSRTTARILCDELMSRGVEHRQMLIENLPRYRTWGVCELLLRKASVPQSDLGAAKNLSLLAIKVAEKLDPAEYSLTIRNDLQARAWASLATSIQTESSDCSEATEALDKAKDFLSRGSRDPLERARYLEAEASLRRRQSQPETAADLLSRAVEIYQEISEPRSACLASLAMARALRASHRTPEAIVILQQTRWLASRAASDLEVEVLLDLVRSLLASGRLQEARALRTPARRCALQLKDRRSLLQSRWIKALLEADAGLKSKAMLNLKSVLASLNEMSLVTESAQATLDMVRLERRLPRTQGGPPVGAITASYA